MREFEVLRKLKHQNIVKLFAVEETVGHLLGQRRMLLTFQSRERQAMLINSPEAFVGGMGVLGGPSKNSRVWDHTGKSLGKERENQCIIREGS